MPKAQDIPIVVQEGGQLDVDGLMRALAWLITQGDAAGYLRRIVRAEDQSKGA